MNCQVCKGEILGDHPYLKYKIGSSPEDNAVCTGCVKFVTEQYFVLAAKQQELQSREANGDNTEDPKDAA